MAKDRQVTPEKQLLNLIEGSDKDKNTGAIAQARRKRGLLSVLSFGAIFGRLSFFKRSTQKKIGRAGKFSISFTLVNRLLLAAVACLLVYVVSDTVASALSLGHLPNIVPQKEPAGAGVENKVSPLKEESYYLQKVNARDVFKEARDGGGVRKEKKEVKPIEESEAVKNLSLVGISWSADPDVIIEDKTLQKTYFVKRGQIVGNNVKIEAVFKDKVVLSSDGQEFELR